MNKIGSNFFIPFQAAYSLLQDAAGRDRTTARRTELAEILWHERYLNRENLMSRVGDRLGEDCFGESAWEDTFNRDISAVKTAFELAGFKLNYSRKKGLNGYYLQNEERLLPELKQTIAHSIEIIDLQQLAYYHDLGVTQRVRQALNASEQTHWATRYVKGQRPAIENRVSIAQFIQNIVQNIVQSMERNGIVYSISGNLAGWIWGESRPASQIDLILSIQGDQFQKLADQLKCMGLILSQELNAEEIIQSHRTVQIIAVHPQNDLRVNLILPQAEDDFYFDAIRRSVRVSFGKDTGSLYVLSAEFLILQSLLEFCIDREPEHLRCVAAVMLNRKENLDRVMIGKKAEERGWQRIWEELVAQMDLMLNTNSQRIQETD